MKYVGTFISYYLKIMNFIIWSFGLITIIAIGTHRYNYWGGRELSHKKNLQITLKNYAEFG